MIKAYFISDIHLGTDKSQAENDKQELFARFLEEIYKDATHLYIVGDLFDFWFEYKHVIPKEYFRFLVILDRFVQKGVEIHYLAGNHDFALGSFFDSVLNIKTWPDKYTFKLESKNFYLFHGDGIAKKDVGYRFLKRILRHPFNIKLYRWLHPDLGIPFAKKVSGGSRHYTNTINHLRDESDYIEFAEECFKDGYDYVLMGHRHNPLVHKNKDKCYINLGDWTDNYTYALFDGKNLELKWYKKEKGLS